LRTNYFSEQVSEVTHLFVSGSYAKFHIMEIVLAVVVSRMITASELFISYTFNMNLFDIRIITK